MSEPARDHGQALYPFLYASIDEDEVKVAALHAAVQQSTLAKCSEVVALRTELLAEYENELVDAARAMADCFAKGGKLIAFGNGGSATDADDAAADCLMPPVAGWRPLPALSLPADSATVTALTNDVGFDHVFTRQIAALGERGDIALAFSTSGNSPNVVAAILQAGRRGLLTVALCGYDGGALARGELLDHCFIARREFVPRIQEGHATLWHTLLELVQKSLAERDGARQ
ncbi:MAG: SIS domain-containing protein [Gemmatimonadaceae bacterium]